MKKIVLRELESGDEKAFFQGLEEWEGESRHWHTFIWEEGMSFEEMLKIMDDRKNGRNLPSHIVPDTMLYGFIDKDTIVGRVSIRHELNEYLKKRGGHLGYGVAPRFRQKGYASEMVRQSLDHCRSIGLKKIMLTCADTNIASSKIIEKYNGVLEGKIWDEEDKEWMKKYWIDLAVA